jgi:hypothetical protein
LIARNWVRFAILGARGEGWRYGHEIRGECEADGGVRLKSFELAQGTEEGSLDAGVMAGETVELGGGIIGERGAGCEGVELGFHGADAAEIPG